jgi:hypothetical protein
MSTADGSVLGTTKIVDAGPPSLLWDLVLLGDGYRSSQLAQFASDTQAFVNVLFATPPFDALGAAINVFRVDVTSTDSGADDPTACGGTGAVPATYFDASFCNSGTRRLLLVNTATVLNTLAAQVPQWTAALVVVNSTVYGGAGGTVGTFSLAAGANEIGLHELGHTAFGLADEYEYFLGCGIDTDRNVHPAAEPAEPNVTINTDRQTLKWRNLVAASTPIPTTRNADCTQCDAQPEPGPTGRVGLYEGAHYFHCGAFRPQFDCRMRALGRPFCAACQQRIRSVLTPHIPATVPDVRELRAQQAGNLIRAAHLVPRFVGQTSSTGWVYSQRPRAGTVVARDSTVTCQMRTGPIP